jgi:hypothetical protein
VSKAHAGSCHCGAIRITIPRTPDAVTRCNCSLCTKLGTRWIYFRPDEVGVSGVPLDDYVRSDLTEPALATQRCRNCGTIVCWRAFDPDYARMGLNANLFDPEMIDALTLTAVNGREWDE